MIARRTPAADRIARPGFDPNGREIAPVLALFSEDELAAARRLVRLHGYRQDLVGLDPAGPGWRFLRDAVVSLGGKDPGRCFKPQRTTR